MNTKINIFARKIDSNKYLYVYSTKQSKTCKEAKNKYIEANSDFCKDMVIKAAFDYNEIKL